MEPSAADPVSTSKPRATHIVGVGSSAGGIEALSELLSHIEAESSAAYVFVQHMSPEFKTMLPEILGRNTGKKVAPAEDGHEIGAGELLLIPPGRVMTMFNGRILLEERDDSRDHGFFPVDRFLESLARDAGPLAVAAILSGTGSDGTLGAQAIVRAGGQVLVQTPGSAKFPGMPRSVVASGVPHSVLEVGEIPQLIDAIASGIRTIAARPKQADTPATALDRILYQIRCHHSVDFSKYRPELVERRIDRRSQISGSSGLDEYASLIRSDIRERQNLYDDLLLGITDFNRYPEGLEAIEKVCLPNLLEGRPSDQPLRLWCAGCSTGEEAYLLAFCVHRFLKANGHKHEFKVFGTDVDEKALRIASRGMYSAEEMQERAAAWSDYWFVRDESAHIGPGIRRNVVFASHDVIEDPPFPNIDLVSCCNLLIYLKDDAKEAVLRGFRYTLGEGGYLLVGPKESPEGVSEHFARATASAPLFRCTKSANAYRSNAINSAAFPTAKKNPRLQTRSPLRPRGFSSLLYETLAQRFIGAALVITREGSVEYFLGNVKEFLAPVCGKSSYSLESVLPPDICDAVTGLVRSVPDEEGASHSSHVLVALEKGKEPVSLGVTVTDLGLKNAGNSYLLVALKIDPEVLELPSRAAKGRGAGRGQAEKERRENERLRRQIDEARNEMASVVGQLEASNEELRTTNEELQTGGEELQSTNEELQAVNEELYTVNAECQLRISELSEMSSEVESVYEVSGIGVLFVDTSVRVTKFNRIARRLFNLLPDDIGRPISHFSSNLSVKVADQVSHTLGTMKVHERQVTAASGETYLMRIAPYRSEHLEVRGAVLVFIDISALTISDEVSAPREPGEEPEATLH